MPSASTVITMSAGISPSDATATEWRPSRSSSMTPVCTGSGLWGIDHSRADLVGKRDRDRPPGRLSGWGAPGLEPQPFLEHVDARRRRPHARQALEQGDRPRHGCPRLDRERIEIGQAGAGGDARSVFLVAAALVGCQQRRGAGIAQEGRPAGVGEGHGPAAGVAEHDWCRIQGRASFRGAGETGPAVISIAPVAAGETVTRTTPPPAAAADPRSPPAGATPQAPPPAPPPHAERRTHTIGARASTRMQASTPPAGRWFRRIVDGCGRTARSRRRRWCLC